MTMSPLVRTPLSIEHALLGFLRPGPLHGYEILRRLDDPAGLGLVWTLKQSHLYGLLARLEDEGYVASRREPQESRPTRKVFELTRSGEATYWDWVQSPVARGRELRLDFLAKLYFAQREGAAVVARLIEGQKAALEDWLAAQRGHLSEGRGPDFEWQVLQFRAGQIEAMLAWLDASTGQAAPPQAPPPP